MVDLNRNDQNTERTIRVPAPTAWPIVLAFGMTLSFASLVTSAMIGAAGLLLVAAGAVGWFREVLPHENHEYVEIVSSRIISESARTGVEHIEVSALHRARLPIESYPVLAGVRGAIAGGVAMVVPALLYGLLAHGSIWYAVNLLGGAGVATWSNPTTEEISAFHWNGLVIATTIHAATSLLVGLLYGAILPMWPSRPLLLGGLVAPLASIGLLHSTLGFINPFFAARISWGWFAASELLFGVVAGMVVARTERIRTHQSVPFMLRMGIEAKEFLGPEDEK